LSLHDYCWHGTLALGTPCKACDMEKQSQIRQESEFQAKVEELARRSQSIRDAELEKLRTENAKLRAVVEAAREHGKFLHRDHPLNLALAALEESA
jgi:hypothetical protein